MTPGATRFAAETALARAKRRPQQPWCAQRRPGLASAGELGGPRSRSSPAPRPRAGTSDTGPCDPPCGTVGAYGASADRRSRGTWFRSCQPAHLACCRSAQGGLPLLIPPPRVLTRHLFGHSPRVPVRSRIAAPSRADSFPPTVSWAGGGAPARDRGTVSRMLHPQPPRMPPSPCSTPLPRDWSRIGRWGPPRPHAPHRRRHHARPQGV